jgi:hypothetical protein
MIAGSAILNCPVSMVTINVAKEATDRDHQRLRTGDEEAVCDGVIGNLGEKAAVQSSRNAGIAAL